SQTQTIKLGAGAVLLPHYSPYKIAENYNLLSVLFPGRVDLGLGRAPGGSAEASIALSGNYLEKVKKYPESVKTLNHFINNEKHDNSLYNKIQASPIPSQKPTLWVLGTSEKSIEIEIENKLNYVFGHFMSNANGTEIITKYRKKILKKNKKYEKTIVTKFNYIIVHFISNDNRTKIITKYIKKFFKKHETNPEIIIAVSVICAETTKQAEKIARSTAIWSAYNDTFEFDQIPS